MTAAFGSPKRLSASPELPGAPGDWELIRRGFLLAAIGFGLPLVLLVLPFTVADLAGPDGADITAALSRAAEVTGDLAPIPRLAAAVCLLLGSRRAIDYGPIRLATLLLAAGEAMWLVSGSGNAAGLVLIGAAAVVFAGRAQRLAQLFGQRGLALLARWGPVLLAVAFVAWRPGQGVLGPTPTPEEVWVLRGLLLCLGLVYGGVCLRAAGLAAAAARLARERALVREAFE